MKPDNDWNEITKQNIIECVLKIHDLERVAIADAMLFSYHAPEYDFEIKEMINSLRETIRVNQKLRIAHGFDDI